MEVSAATRPVPGGVNDDTFVCGPGFAAVLDGATAPASRDSGCVHDVPWLVARLSGHLAGLLPRGGDEPLAGLLAAAIERTRADHRGTCDLSNPDSPSSTVTILRERADDVDYLVLGDSPLVLHGADDRVEVIVDDRVDHLPDYSFDAVARLRNSPEGFWVASTVPEAAGQALSGSVPRSWARRALLLTDGASRLVDRYGRDWPDLLRLAGTRGPEALVAEVHAEDERVATVRESRNESIRGKRFDDATAVLCRFGKDA